MAAESLAEAHARTQIRLKTNRHILYCTVPYLEKGTGAHFIPDPDLTLTRCRPGKANQ